MQPVYHKCNYKIKARALNIGIYRKLTGLKRIPVGKQYWTLANWQPPEEGSEIVQMINSGLLKKNQFHGIDRDEEIITHNREWHPEAHWYKGEWNDVVAKANFNPALIYLDITGFADNNIACNAICQTMMICPPKTVLLANVMLNDCRSSRQFDHDYIIRYMAKQIPGSELKQWRPDVHNYIYSATGRTYLMTYVFYKP